jgi:hypothetical protein
MMAWLLKTLVFLLNENGKIAIQIVDGDPFVLRGDAVAFHKIMEHDFILTS